MGCMTTLHLTSSSPGDTADLARTIAPRLNRGDCILLSGHIGGGKTHFARSLIQSQLEQPEDVPSPTFTLVQTYPTPRFEIWHCDLYRLSHPDELFELGLTDAFENALCLIEWPDRLGDLAPPTALSLEFQASDTEGQRQITARYSDPRWDFLRGIAHV